jgi:hypothetical protein
MIKMNSPEILIKRSFMKTRLSDQFLANSYEIIFPILTCKELSLLKPSAQSEIDPDLERTKAC